MVGNPILVDEDILDFEAGALDFCKSQTNSPSYMIVVRTFPPWHINSQKDCLDSNAVSLSVNTETAMLSRIVSTCDEEEISRPLGISHSHRQAGY